MFGKIYITRTGYDPQQGGYIKDPYLDGIPTMGACRPDIREQLDIGDSVFVISGRVRGFEQFIMGGFDIAEKITMEEAYTRYPEQRLTNRPDGQLSGNIIIDRHGNQHPLDDHTNIERRKENYLIGHNEIVLRSSPEIQRARLETMDILRDIFKKNGRRPFDIVGRSARNLDQGQVQSLKTWLSTIKMSSR